MPSVSAYVQRARGYYQRRSASFVFRRPLPIRTERPVVSFTFDDFPRSALLTGGAILKRYGLAGTYYASLGLAGTEAPAGQMFVTEDLRALVADGHELGCHTFSHCDSWETATAVYEASVVQNHAQLGQILPDLEFKSFSYPISPPRPLTKSRIGKRFESCRGGGQTYNVGTADLNQLSAYFLEKSHTRINDVKDIIRKNRDARGWLILATHDVTDRPTRLGCSPEFFEDVVRYAKNSGAHILTITKAVATLRGAPLL